MVAVSNSLLILAAFLAGADAGPVFESRQISSLPTGWVSVGCYSDVPATRTLRVASFTDVDNMTIESCLAFCTPAGYQFAGVEFARECYCDNVIESPGAPIDDSTCNMPCTGNSAEICGGAGGINIFQNTAATTTSPPPPPLPTSTATIRKTAGTFQYKGCFDDGVDGAPRSLGTQVSVPDGVTAESCTVACRAAGFVLAGLEFGHECWCDSYMPLAIAAPDSDCNMVCDADDSELCGAGNRLAVYQDITATPLDVNQCLTSTQLHGTTFRFNLQTAPASGSGNSFAVGNFELTAQAGQPTFFQLSTAVAREAFTYSLFVDSDILQPDDFEGEGVPVAIAPVAGGFQRFAAFSTFTPYQGYCAKPNPISVFGPFIGPPVLSVSGHADLWAICGRAEVIFSPQSNSTGYDFSQCQSVFLEMTQPIVTF